MTPEHVPGGITMSLPFVDDLVEQIRRERQLTQFLGVALKAVLPAAERGLSNYVVISARLPGDKAVADLVTDTDRAVQRGWAALDRLDKTECHIRNLPSYQFDDTFEVKFEETE